MTTEQIRLARHALGLPHKTKRSYRNRYICGEGTTSFPDWEAMVAAGLATREDFSQNPSTRYWFGLTRAGAEAALLPGERLDREDFPVENKAKKERAIA